VGFRDAYVAAPSKAAALRAWGTEKDLFARGSAEEVTDAASTQDALSKPGEVVYRTRGGLEEQVAALGKLPERKPQRKSAKPEPSKATSTQKQKRPRPSRAGLEAAEAEIIAVQQKRDRADADLRIRESALAAERKTIEARFAKQLDELQRKQEQARKAYEAALRSWEP
jgi:hypothetical protein